MCTSRSALVLYSKIFNKENGKFETYILLGYGKNGITSIGGRKNQGESEIGCLIRELNEETKKILDYSRVSDFFTSNACKKLTHSKCSYFMVKCKYEDLFEIQRNFNKLEKTSEDELSDLNICEISDLIHDVVKNKIQVNKTFREMFLSVGFDWFNKSTWNKEISTLSCKDFDTEVDYLKFPAYISLHAPSANYLPVVYGTISKKYLMSNQYYGFIKGEHLFRVNE
jgi:hypothetical protein